MVPQFPPFPLPQKPLRSASPVLPPLLLPIHSPDAPHPTWSLRVPPNHLGDCGLPPVPGRCPSCEETWILCPPSMPSWLHLCLSFYFLLAQNLKVHERWKITHSVSSLGILIALQIHTDLYTPTSWSELFKAPGHLISQFSPLHIMGTHLLAPTVSLPWAAEMLSCYCWLFSANALGLLHRANSESG